MHYWTQALLKRSSSMVQAYLLCFNWVRLVVFCQNPLMGVLDIWVYAWWASIAWIWCIVIWLICCSCVGRRCRGWEMVCGVWEIWGKSYICVCFIRHPLPGFEPGPRPQTRNVLTLKTARLWPRLNLVGVCMGGCMVLGTDMHSR